MEELYCEINEKILLVEKDFRKINHLAQWAFEKKHDKDIAEKKDRLDFSLYFHILDILWNINGGLLWEDTETLNLPIDKEKISYYKKEFNTIRDYMDGNKIHNKIILIQERVPQKYDDIVKVIKDISNGTLNEGYNTLTANKKSLSEPIRYNFLLLETIKVIENILDGRKYNSIPVNTIGMMGVQLDIGSEIKRLDKLLKILDGELPYRLSLCIGEFRLIYVNIEYM